MILETTAIIIGIVYVLSLTAAVPSRAVGLKTGRRSDDVLTAVIFGVTQALAAYVGYVLGGTFSYLFDTVGRYVAGVMMLLVAVKMIADSIKMSKGKQMYSFTAYWGVLILALSAALNVFLVSLVGSYYLPFGNWFFAFVALAALGWAFAALHIKVSVRSLKLGGFVEFSGGVFLIVISVLYMFTNLMKL